jgi:hypothetical protein
MTEDAKPTPEEAPLLPPAKGTNGLRAKLPEPVATAVDRALDVADEVADELKRAIDRLR